MAIFIDNNPAYRKSSQGCFILNEEDSDMAFLDFWSGLGTVKL